MTAPVVSSVCYTLAEPWGFESARVEAGAAFVGRQLSRLPGYLRLAILLLTHTINLGVFLSTGRPLQAHSASSRRQVLARLERVPFGPIRDWFRFHRILMALRCHEGLA